MGTDGRHCHTPYAGILLRRLENLAHVYNKTDVMAYADLKARSDALRGTRIKKMREEKKRLDSVIAERFGTHAPVSLRPVPTRWQGYGKPTKTDLPDSAGSAFDANLIVLSIRGRRVPLTTTLNSRQALRGVLMDCCPQQPPPEWFSGHRSSGTPTTEPHMALLPLPFVGCSTCRRSRYGSGTGPAMVTGPRSLASLSGAFLYSAKTGLPCEHKLFDGQWFECQIELETRERPAKKPKCQHLDAGFPRLGKRNACCSEPTLQRQRQMDSGGRE